MPEVLSGFQLLEKQKEYLREEKNRHERDIATNQGKVQEIIELLDNLEKTCLYCATVIYVSYKEDVSNEMVKHVKDKHLEEAV